MDRSTTKSRFSKLKLVALIIILVGLLAGGTYSVWNKLFVGNTNFITTDDISIDFLEDNDVINLTNALPLSDNQGKAQSETFDFVVTTDTKRNIDIPYKILIEKMESDEGKEDLLNSDIKVYLTDEDD